ncbi:hypothetical protein ACRALDRAFT_1077944 [Sodiomyces alcalophilus JCM 7366]|uniref:uncharacterized protein n=1 Tax=Sodiomyces alcalophilus JCM 7366 TaxID=591952 RepID=UPI0039B46F47
MDATSPAKRRALAPLDANAISPKPTLSYKASQQKLQLPPRGPLGLKRPLHSVGLSENVPVKKQCQEPQPQSQQQQQQQQQQQSRLTSAAERLRPVALRATATGREECGALDGETLSTTRRPSDRHQDQQQQQQQQQQSQSQPRPGTLRQPRSVSPDASSVFDNSVTETSHDTSQDTTITEPDATQQGSAYQPYIMRPRRTTQPMPREEARKKAEILRLRLGLASYKLQTGQTDVPLERLQVKPVPGGRLRRTTSSLSTATTTSTGPAQAQSSQNSGEGGDRNDADTRDRPFGPNPRRIAMPSRMVRMSHLNRMRGASPVKGSLPPSDAQERRQPGVEGEERPANSTPKRWGGHSAA